ncbi:MAG TPA: MMPL family transporter [Planctomycetaceae bacterium]|nr:MMPL family transporter [Planctomycetaceae bacterium]
MPEPVLTRRERLVDWLIRGRYVLFPAVLVLLAAAWPASQRLEYDRSIESLYTADDPRLAAYRDSKRLFGGDEFIIVAWTDPELLDEASGKLTPAAEDRIRSFSRRLSEIPGVNPRSTQNLARAMEPKPLPFSIPFFPDQVQLAPDEVHQLLRGILIGDDDQTTAIVLRLLPQGERPVRLGETIRQVRAAAADFERRTGFRTFVVGEPVQVHDMFDYVDDDGTTLFRWSLGLLAGVVLVLFRSPRWVALPLVVVLASVVWTKAVLVLSGARLSMVSSMLNSLVTIIGIATVMHVIVHYRERRRELARREAFRETFVVLLPAVFWTCATTAAGFAALLSSHITPVRSFALMMSLATGMVLAASVLALPGGALIGRFSPDPHDAPGEARLTAFLGRLGAWVLRWPGTIGLVGFAIAAFTGAGLFRLEVETDFSKNFRADSPILRSLTFFETRLGGAGTWEVNFPAPKDLSDEYLGKVRMLADRLRAEIGSGEKQLTKVVAITDPIDAMERHVSETYSVLVSASFRRLPAAQKVRLVQQLQPEFVESLYNPQPGDPDQPGRMRIVLRGREQQQARSKLELIGRVERIVRNWADGELAGDVPNAPDADPEATGLYVLLAFLVQSLLGDQLVSFLLAAAGIWGMLTFAFRSLRVGLISLVPNVFPIVLVVGSLGWIGLPINIATAMIASVSLGLTVDATIHYIAAFRRAQALGLGVDAALIESHRGVGRALVFANLALIVGFSVLTLSHFIPLVYFGILLSVAMLGGLAAALLLLPILLRWAVAGGRRPASGGQ